MALRKKTNTKIFVLDTSVILYNHDAIHVFEEHDVAIPISVLEELDTFKKGNDTKNFEAREFIRIIPISVLEELDTFKKGNDTKNFEAREFIRILDSYAHESTFNEWIPIKGKGKGKFKVVLEEQLQKDVFPNAIKAFGVDKADHRIINVAITLSKEFPNRKVVLVSKDINLRIKAK